MIKDKKSGDSHDIYNHGQAVVARFGGRKKYHEGTIIYHNADGTYAIQYGDVTESEKRKKSAAYPWKTERMRKEQLLLGRHPDGRETDVHPFYRHVSWRAHVVVSNPIFEILVMLAILLVGVAIILALENEGTDDARILLFMTLTGTVTTVVFVLECVLKIIAEGPEPFRFFNHADDGYFNTLDFFIVVCTLVEQLSGGSGGPIAGLRMLRLLRLLIILSTKVSVLRAIISGLLSGMKSVLYIVVLLWLVIYIFAILGCSQFGDNDPARFGTVRISMLSLFQVSTLASWTNMAYVSWYGCSNYLRSPYHGSLYDEESIPRRIDTGLSNFLGFQCSEDTPLPITTNLFFSIYILLTSWVIMSLFIGVISMGMFDSFLDMKHNSDRQKFDELTSEEADNGIESGIRKRKDSLGQIPGQIITQFGHAFGHQKEKKLHDRIDIMLANDLKKAQMDSADQITCQNPCLRRLEPYVEKAASFCVKVRDHSGFIALVTFSIVMVSIMVGIDADMEKTCMRLSKRVDYMEAVYDSSNPREAERFAALKKRSHDCESKSEFSSLVDWACLFIFTFEAVVKIVAEGTRPQKYFEDRWNLLDFFVIVVTYVELTPLAFIFSFFPIIILRLLRLLRVLRLAKTLPRLRAIVEALISGFSAVGWIVCFILIFNLLSGATCMMLFRKNDPFHWGSLSRSMFTILRLETLDAWEEVMYIAMFGCDNYPNTYPYLTSNPQTSCEDPGAFGWTAAMLLFAIAIFGAYVLPTILIGIVSIKFDEESKQIKSRKSALNKVKQVMDTCKVTGVFSVLNTERDIGKEPRVMAAYEVFEVLDENQASGIDVCYFTEQTISEKQTLEQAYPLFRNTYLTFYFMVFFFFQRS